MNNKLTMIEIFAGIGAQERALRQLGIPYEITATMDVDKDAILSYASMRCDFEKELSTYEFPSKEEMVNTLQAKNVGFDFVKQKHSITMKTNLKKVEQYYLADKIARNLGDVSLCKQLPNVDVIFHSSPCQSFSQAGKGAGGDEGSGTTSSLMWESLRLIGASKPRFIIWENVAAVLSGKHRHNFIKYLERLSEMGYESTFDLLNSKNFGIPQNRLRIFCVSHRIDDVKSTDIAPYDYNGTNKQVKDTLKEILDNDKINLWSAFTFPEEIPLTIRLKNVLEKNVDEKYYLPDDRIEKIINSSFTQEKKRIQMTDICDTLLARDWKDPKCVPIEDDPQIIQKFGDRGTNQYSVRDYAHTIPANPMSDRGQMVVEPKVEPFVVASRGRNPENPSDRTVGVPTEQRLEPNFSGCTNTLTSVQKDNYVCEPQVLRAERTEYGKEIRKQYEAGEIDEKIGNMREMKPRTDGISNTITTVQKDNYVCEPKIEKNLWTETQKQMITEDGNVKRYINSDVVDKFDVGDCADISFPNGYNKANRVFNGYVPAINGTTTQSSFVVKEPIAYDEQNKYIRKDGCVGTITTDGSSPKHNNRIIDPIIYDDYNSRIPQDQDAITTLTTNCGASAERNGVKVIEPIVCEERRDEGIRLFKDDCVGTLRTIDACGDKRVLEPEINPVRLGNIYGEQFGTGYAGNVWDDDAISPALMTMQGGNRQPMVVDNIKWRIRKLTPKECWRLMGFTDKDVERAGKYVSASALYKQAGNSICTCCLIAIFNSLIFGDSSTNYEQKLIKFTD